MSLGSDLWVRLSLTGTPLADLTDVTIQTDNANRVFQGNVAIQVIQPGDQLWNQAIQVTLPDDQILN